VRKLLHHRTRYILLEQFSFFFFLFFPNKKIHSKRRKAKREREREREYYGTGFLAETEVDEEGTQGGEKDTKSNGTKTCN